jgi:hypothetical protein
MRREEAIAMECELMEDEKMDFVDGVELMKIEAELEKESLFNVTGQETCTGKGMGERESERSGRERGTGALHALTSERHQIQVNNKSCRSHSFFVL